MVFVGLTIPETVVQEKNLLAATSHISFAREFSLVICGMAIDPAVTAHLKCSLDLGNQIKSLEGLHQWALFESSPVADPDCGRQVW